MILSIAGFSANKTHQDPQWSAVGGPHTLSLPIGFVQFIQKLSPPHYYR